MKKQRCPKCHSPLSVDHGAWQDYRCGSQTDHGESTHISQLCRKRCKVAKLKKQVAKLKQEIIIIKVYGGIK